jgi:hypothetical protein
MGKYWSNANTPEQNLAATYPRLSRTSSANNYLTSDFFLIDGSYMRVKNLTLSYLMKQVFLRRTGIKGLKIYISGNDLFTFSKFPDGIDPESTGSGYPIMRTVMAGINVNF